jgi:hypothetical protein
MTEITAPSPAPAPVELLILGAGWTATFLRPLLRARGIAHAATQRAPAPGADTLAFAFDPESDDAAPFAALPDARTVLVTFPIKVSGGSRRLVDGYMRTRKAGGSVLFVQLGSTGIWDVCIAHICPSSPGVLIGAQGSPTLDPARSVWKDRHSAYDTANARAQAEAELLALASDATPTTVLNLCGLWGGARDPRNWVARVAPSKAALAAKGALHMVHGADVARAVLAAHGAPGTARGERWLVTDGRVYDWWDLAGAWGAGAEARWVRELMREHGVRALPRAPEVLGRALDGREFWEAFALEPTRPRLERD